MSSKGDMIFIGACLFEGAVFNDDLFLCSRLVKTDSNPCEKVLIHLYGQTCKFFVGYRCDRVRKG